MNYKNKNKMQDTSLGYSLSKLPCEIDFEKAVLGALLMEPDAILRISNIRPEMMFHERNKHILETIFSLHSENKPIDIITVVNKLSRLYKIDEDGGLYYVTELTLGVTSNANLEYHCLIIYEMFIKREIIRICSEKIRVMYDKGSDGLLEINNLVKELELLTVTSKKDFKGFKDLVNTSLEKIKSLQESGIKLTGIDTGYDKMNTLLCGWQNTDLIIIAARPATGKSAFVLNIAEKVALQGIPVAIFSLEMSSNQLVDRLISKITNIPANRLKSASLSQDDWNIINSQKYQYPMYIDDTPSLNINDFKAKARRAKKEYGIGFIIVDYLQLMTTYEKGNRDQQLGEISRTLKAIAKELNVPVIALSQLNRDIEKSTRLPRLSDLRESGNIEQDADIVAFLHNNGDYADEISNISLVFAKQRLGAVGIIPFDFIKERQTFEEK